MKPSTPSLIVYFVSCFAFVFFSYFENQNLVLLFKSVIIPSIFVYYLVENEYRFDWFKVMIIFLCFLGDIIILLDLKLSLVYSVYLFLLVYLMVLKLVLDELKLVYFRSKDFFPITIVITLFVYLLITILSLQFQRDKSDCILYAIYGSTLCLLSIIGTANYIAKGSLTTYNCALMITCFVVSDVFYALDHFYLNLLVFKIITLTSQVLCYFFMVKYFLDIDKKKFKPTPQ